jgi:hypothetical protein
MFLDRLPIGPDHLDEPPIQPVDVERFGREVARGRAGYRVAVLNPMHDIVHLSTKHRSGYGGVQTNV